MSILDTTIVNVALETLSRELDAPLNTIQWVSTGYLLALATVIPLTGWMTERFGVEADLDDSVALFGLGSALCGLAWSAESLIFFRVLQGFGGGMIMPVGMALLAQTAGPHAGRPRDERRRRADAARPDPRARCIGGVIVDKVSWRWIFYVNVPIAGFALVLAARLLKSDAGRADAGRLDWHGLLLLSPGLALFVFGLSESESHGGFGDPVVWVPILAGLGARRRVRTARAARPAPAARRAAVPRRGFSAAAATTFLVGAALFGAMILLPLYYQVARGENALDGRPADGAAGARRGAGDAARGPAHRPRRRRPRRARRAGPDARRRSRSRSSTARHVVHAAGRRCWWCAASGSARSMMPAMAAAYATLQRAGDPARDERAERRSADRRLDRHGRARRRAAGPDQGSARGRLRSASRPGRLRHARAPARGPARPARRAAGGRVRRAPSPVLPASPSLGLGRGDGICALASAGERDGEAAAFAEPEKQVA